MGTARTLGSEPRGSRNRLAEAVNRSRGANGSANAGSRHVARDNHHGNHHNDRSVSPRIEGNSPGVGTERAHAEPGNAERDINAVSTVTRSRADP